MSIYLMTEVWKSNLEPTRKAVMLVLANFANDEGENAYPAVGTIASMTSYTRRTVQRALSSLIDDGLLVMEGETVRGTNLYRISINALKTYEGDVTDTQGGVIESGGGDSVTQGGDSVTGGGVTVTPNPFNYYPVKLTKNTTTTLCGENFENSPGLETRNKTSIVWEGVTGYAGMPAGQMGEEIELAISRIRGRHSTTQEAIDYLKPYFQAFRQRYPGSTRIFWLTEWATQGIIPAERKPQAVTQAGRAAPARNGRLEGAALEAAMNAECERLEREAKEKREWQR